MTLTYAGRTGHTSRVVNRPIRPVNGPVNETPTYGPMRERPRRPAPPRPSGGATRYRGTAVAVSRAPHRRRSVSMATTVGLALAAGAITLWLGLMANFGSMANGDSAEASAGVPDSLAVVRVEPGESLQDVAARVAPHAPIRQVAQRIRELNALDAGALAAGQTLIAPVG